MRSALIVVALVALPLAAAQDVRLTAPETPLHPELVAGLMDLAAAMTNAPAIAPCIEPPANHLCAYVLATAQSIVDAATCVGTHPDVQECLQKLSGIFCLTFHVGATNLVLPDPNIVNLYLDTSVPGAGFELKASPGSYEAQLAHYGTGTYHFVSNTASECDA